VSNEEIFSNPSYEVIFKGSFNDLMEEIWGNELVYISSGEIIGEGLNFSKTFWEKVL
jgi:hypothetical protein